MSAANLPRERWTLVDAVREQARALGSRELARFDDGRTLRYDELDASSDRLAAAFAARGVAPGERVLAFLPNSPEFLVALVAANKCGAIFVPINTELRGAFLEHQLRNSAPRLALVHTELSEPFEHLSADLPVGAFVLVGEGSPEAASTLATRPCEPWARLIAAGGEAPDHVVLPSDASTIIYTSGTTGPAKGVRMPHAHCFQLARGAIAPMSLGADDVYFVCMPFFHSNALFMQLFAVILVGARAVVVRKFSASRWLEDVRRAGATRTNALGVMPEFVYRQPATPRDREHALERILAVPISAEWAHAFEERFGVRFVQGYGMTECNIVAYSDISEPAEPGCAGHVLRDLFDVRIVDPDTDRALPVDATGEIVVRPREPFCFMQGYHAMPERTVEAWRNLWFHTGDAGKLDAHGRLHFVDRIKDCIRRRGENISAYEIEQVLNAHPEVAESAVVAVPSTIPGGEDEVMAFLVIRGGAKLEPELLFEFCRARMPRHALPRYLAFRDALEKTETGKLRKEELKKLGRAAAEHDADGGPGR